MCHWLFRAKSLLLVAVESLSNEAISRTKLLCQKYVSAAFLSMAMSFVKSILSYTNFVVSTSREFDFVLWGIL